MAEATPYAPYGSGESSFATQLRKETAAVRLQFSKFGVRRSLDKDQVGQAARVFRADSKCMSAGKQILDSRDAAWVAVTSPIGKARLFWKTMTVPYPVKGIRLLRRDLMPVFEQTMGKFASELATAKQDLAAAFSRLRIDAQGRLGNLFSQADYPEADQVTGEFGLEWDYPSVEPPDYLKELNPALYEQERQRLENRFAEAAALAEGAFASELQDLVSHLAERMTPDENGKKKQLRKKAVAGFQDFFQRFQSIRVGSNAQIDTLVAQARELMSGVDRVGLDALRGHGETEAAVADTVRDNLRTGMTALREQLDTMLIDQPKRRILLEDE